MIVESIVWLGVRTAHHRELRSLFVDVLGLDATRDVHLIGDGDANEALRRQHLRGPDGNVCEILGPR